MMKKIKNPEVFKKKPFEEFRKDDIVKIKQRGDKLYKIVGANPDDSLAILQDERGREKYADFSQLELVSDELGNKLFEAAFEAAHKSAKNLGEMLEKGKEPEKNEAENKVKEKLVEV